MQMIKEGQFVFLFIRIRPAYIQRKLPEFIAEWCTHANGEHRLFILFYVLKKIRVAFYEVYTQLIGRLLQDSYKPYNVSLTTCDLAIHLSTEMCPCTRRLRTF